MAKIALRAYNREVESLIERGQNQEAIAHCKHILRYFPKCIDTYRLLGKAYLESQRYTEAADILQRILSVVPDDFVSQIGTSIIREDEGNLDAAIYHMERAFEVQPSNTAIQEELRRLYGRRDGVEPPRVRLTRGALVRMYARGDLYRQAIAEARAALAEDPKRIDLEVILAQMFYQSGQKVEATEVCGRLVTKLPYCLVANQILSEILPSTSRAEDAKLYAQRIQALDPYQAYVSQNAPTSELVPEQAITLDHLEYVAEETAAQEPSWAKSVGIQLAEDQKTEEVIPDWMGAVNEDKPPSTPANSSAEITAIREPILPAEELPALEKAEIPDWMKEAGWGPSDGEPKEQSAPTDVFDVPDLSAEVLPGDIPEWLAEVAPKEALGGELPEDEDKLSWLGSILPEPTQESPEIQATISPVESSENFPDWMEKAEEEKPGDIINEPGAMVEHLEGETPAPAAEPGESLIPDWLSSTPTEQGSVSENLAQETDLPDWLRSFESPDTQGKAEQTKQEFTEFGDQVGQEKPTVADVVPEEEVTSFPVDIPQPELSSEQIDHGLTPEISSTAQESIQASPSDIDAAMAWLESLAVKQGASEALTTSPEERVDTPPDWVQREIAAETTEENDHVSDIEEIASEKPPIDVIAEPVTAFDQESVKPTDSIEHLEETQTIAEGAETTKSPESPEALANMDADAAFAWLEALAAKQGATEALILTPEQRKESPPDWVTESIEEQGSEEKGEGYEESPINQPESSLPTPEEETPIPEAPAVRNEDGIQEQGSIEAALPESAQSLEMPSGTIAEPASEELPTAEMDADAAFAWLEALAAKQGATEALLLTPEERSDTPPEWVSLAQESSTEEQPGEPAISLAEPIGEEEQPEKTPPTVQMDESAQDIPLHEEAIQAPASPEGNENSILLTLEHEEGVNEFSPSENAEMIQGESIGPEPVEPEPEVDHSELPAWLKDISPDAEPALPVGENAPAETWLREFETKEGEPTDISGKLVEENETENLPESLVEQRASKKQTGQLKPRRGREAKNEPVKEEALATLEQARAALRNGNLGIALEQYNELIQKNDLLDETINDLQEALYRYPVDISIWQAIGDAFARDDRLQDALDAYTKAEELLR